MATTNRALSSTGGIRRIVGRESRDWMIDALCRGHPHPEWWFPHVTEGERAREICARCPVIAECADYALRVEQTHGIVAGIKLRGLYKIDDDRELLAQIADFARNPMPESA